MIMWKRVFAVAFLLSLSLNIGFGVTWALRRFGGESQGQPEQKPESEIWSPLHRELDVTKEQWQKLEPMVESFQRKTQRQAHKLQGLRSEMVDLLSAKEVDRGAIEQQQEKVLEGFRGMQDIVLDHLIGEKQVLTADQEKQLFELIRSRTGCPVVDGGPMAPKRGGNPGVGSVLREMEKGNTDK